MADPTGAGSNGGSTTVVSNPPNPPTTNTVPNTTTDTKTVEFQSSVTTTTTQLSNAETTAAFDGIPAGGQTTALPTTAKSVEVPTTPSQTTPPTTKSVFDPKQDPQESAFNPAAAVPNPAVTAAAQLNDPLAGLSPTQLQSLGGADPTDPYIRARLGIPQLPGSTLTATSGFGFGNLTTNLPSIDNALGTIKSLFNTTVGSLFSNTTASNTAATTGSGTAALVAPTGPATTLSKVDATTTEGFGIQTPVDKTTLEGFGVQATVDPTTLEGYGVPATNDTNTVSNKTTTLSADQADAFYNGTGTPTTAQVLAQDQQLAADAAKLYPGTSNKALLNIDKGYAAIEQNTAGIANAEKIVAANNAELADPATSDARRAELLANNQAQQDYIQVATENSIVQQNVIEQNANVFAAGGGNEGDGLAPNQVSALADPAVAQTPVDPTTLEGFGVQAPVDPTTLEGYGVPPTETEANALIEEMSPAPVDPTTDGELQAAVEAANAADINAQIDAMSPENVQPTEVENQAAVEAAIAADQTTASATDVLSDEDAALYDQLANRADRNAAINATQTSALLDQEQGSQQAAIVAKAKQQSTIQARYKQPGNTDWRVRLSLAPGAQYLYNAENPGILAPLRAGSGTDGVIFPYTPSITTTYSANYEQYDLTHSNYRGLFYKNSRVGDIQIRGTFTAQNTTEANYLLAVIHFFRSATKMFYGQDPQRGTPPPICLLNGLGGYQFSDHPVVISSFNYTLPNDVDYIRTTNPNNFGLNLNNRYNPAGASLPAGGSLAGVNRLLNALLPKGAQPQTPAPNSVAGSVTNNTPASYVPTKMEIDITLIPAQTRAQISKQFSLAGFANGDLLKGGFW